MVGSRMYQWEHVRKGQWSSWNGWSLPTSTKGTSGQCQCEPRKNEEYVGNNNAQMEYNNRITSECIEGIIQMQNVNKYTVMFHNNINIPTNGIPA
jgi:hypothetical protein